MGEVWPEVRSCERLRVLVTSMTSRAVRRQLENFSRSKVKSVEIVSQAVLVEINGKPARNRHTSNLQNCHDYQYKSLRDPKKQNFFL